MGFTGFSEEDGEPSYDTRESAIERAKQMRTFGNNPRATIMVHRKWLPLWFAHLVKNTPLEFLGYEELSE